MPPKAATAKRGGAKVGAAGRGRPRQSDVQRKLRCNVRLAHFLWLTDRARARNSWRPSPCRQEATISSRNQGFEGDSKVPEQHRPPPPQAALCTTCEHTLDPIERPSPQWRQLMLTTLLRFEKSPCPSDHKIWISGGSRKRSRPFKKPPRLSWFTYSRTQTCALSTPRESPSCKKTSNWQGGYVVSGEVRAGSERHSLCFSALMPLGGIEKNISVIRRSRIQAFKEGQSTLFYFDPAHIGLEPARWFTETWVYYVDSSSRVSSNSVARPSKG